MKIIALVLSLSAVLVPLHIKAGPQGSATENKGSWNHWNVPHTATGDIVYVPLKSAVFHNTRMLRVWLPPGYRTTNRRYPVMYLNDGQDLFDEATATFDPVEWGVDESMAALCKTRAIEPFIVVGVDNAGHLGRPHEYLPWPDMTLKPVDDHPVGASYPKFLLNEVIPLIQKRFRTKPGAANRALGGASYGAGIALYTVITRPGSFGKLLLESPSLYANDFRLLTEAAKLKRWPGRIYLGCGLTDSEPVDDVHKLEAILRSAGLGPNRFYLLFQKDGRHNSHWWGKRFSVAARFLFPR